MIFQSTSRVAPENRPHTGWRVFLNMGVTNGVIEMAEIDRERELGISWESVKKQLHYDPLTGIFMRLNESNQYVVAGSFNQKGRNRIEVCGKRFLASRLAWFIYYGEWPEDTVDHINGNPSDDRIDNLRLATNSEQQWNTGVRRNNTSGAKGVSFNKRRNEAGLSPWEVYITVFYKRIHIGFFDDFDCAVEARRKASMTYHGNFGFDGGRGCEVQWIPPVPRLFRRCV